VVPAALHDSHDSSAITAVLLITNMIPMPSLDTVGTVAPEIAYMGLVAGFVGVLCWNIGNKILTPLNGVLFMDVVPITAFAVSTAEGIVPGNLQFVGALLSAAALILNNLYLRHRFATPATAKPSPVSSKNAEASQEESATV